MSAKFANPGANADRVSLRESVVDSFRVFGDRYIVELMSFDQVTKGGIYLPQMAEDTQGFRIGRVLRVGNGHLLERNEVVEMFAKVGEVVMFERYTGRDYPIGSKLCTTVSQKDVLQVCEGL